MKEGSDVTQVPKGVKVSGKYKLSRESFQVFSRSGNFRNFQDFALLSHLFLLAEMPKFVNKNY